MKGSTRLIALFILVMVLASPVCSRSDLTLYDVLERRTMALSSALPVLQRARLVTVGELHDRLEHHLAQREVIKALHESGTFVMVGLEMFERRNQQALDAWISGDLAEDGFMVHFRANWGDTWPLYRDVFRYCRDQSIPMIGLNVPRSIVRQVSRKGFDSLSENQLGQLPPVSCNVTPEYMELLRSTFGHHGSEQSFSNFCEAQVVWDTAMAYHALQALEEAPGAIMVVLAGAIHAWRPGIPARVALQSPGTPLVSILPETREMDRESVTVKDCDYLFHRG